MEGPADESRGLAQRSCNLFWGSFSGILPKDLLRDLANRALVEVLYGDPTRRPFLEILCGDLARTSLLEILCRDLVK